MKLRASHVAYLWDAINGLLWAAVIIVLAGCSPYWVKSAEPVSCVKQVVHPTYESLRQACSYQNATRTLHACVNYPTPGVGVIHLGPNSDACDMRHERAHCEGWRHDGREIYKRDCGPEQETL